MAGYAVMRGMGDYGTVNRENSYSAANRPLAGSGPMSPIAEMGDKNMVDNISDNNVGFGESRTNSYGSNFPVGSWDDSAMMSAAATKGLTDDDRTLSGGLNASETPQVCYTFYFLFLIKLNRQSQLILFFSFLGNLIITLVVEQDWRDGNSAAIAGSSFKFTKNLSRIICH